MAANSGIEWTEATWNPLAGCTRHSPGCEHCYAETMTKRLAAMGQRKYQGLLDARGRFNGAINLDEDAWMIPVRRTKPTTYFVNSMSDLFHENVPEKFINLVFGTMAFCVWHRFIVLTKRADRMRDFILANRGKPLPNVILGVSAENQKYADERIPLLLHTPAACRVVSAEPLLGPIDLSEYHEDGIPTEDDLNCDPLTALHRIRHGVSRLHWIICGGESGPGARPMHPQWVRDLRDQCVSAGVPFFFKQWGEWLPGHQYQYNNAVNEADPDLEQSRFKCIAWNESGEAEEVSSLWCDDGGMDEHAMFRVGKSRAGRLLDGREWSEYPQELRKGNYILNPLDKHEGVMYNTCS